MDVLRSRTDVVRNANINQDKSFRYHIHMKLMQNNIICNKYMQADRLNCNVTIFYRFLNGNLMV